MPRILESIEIAAPRDRLWDVISDLDNEPKYWWGTRSVKNLSKDGDVINRQIYQNFGDHPIQQKVILKPKSQIEIQYLKGVTEGTKVLRVTSLEENKQNLLVEWNVRFPGIFRIGTPFIAGHVRKGTREALRRIKDVSEGRPLEERISQTSK